MSNFNTVLLRFLRYRQEIAVIRAESLGEFRRELAAAIKPLAAAMAPRMAKYVGPSVAPKVDVIVAAQAMGKLLVAVGRDAPGLFAHASADVLLVIDWIEKELAPDLPVSSPEYVAARDNIFIRCGRPTEDERAIASNQALGALLDRIAGPSSIP